MSADKSETPRTDREVYKTGKSDIGFEVVSPNLARQLEMEISKMRENYNRHIRRVDLTIGVVTVLFLVSLALTILNYIFG